MQNHNTQFRPSNAFVGASWVSLFLGMGGYMIGLWNSTMAMNEKGFYFAILVLGLFAAISLQKSVRDKLEGIRITGMYLNVCRTALALALLMLTVGLYNATFELAVKGFYGMAYVFSLFAVVTCQKNVRDLELFRAPADEFVASKDKAHQDPL